MTPSDLERRYQKFRKRAPFIANQKHLDAVMASFPKENRTVAIERVSGVLSPQLIASEDVVEVKPKDPEKPNVTEETVNRLNMQAAQILSQQAEIEKLRKDAKELGERIAELSKQVP